MSAPTRGRRPDSKVTLKLSRGEVDLILIDAAPALGLAQAISASTSEGRFQQVRLEFAEWVELAGYLSKQAYGTTDVKRQDRLDGLIERIEDLIDEEDEP